jgi:hypothetical protein
METKNVYEDIVYLTFNIFKNEKTRTMIKLDYTFEEKVLVLINDILLLEKDFEASWAEKTWFAEYAKCIVNIMQKKLKFEKVDNKKVDETYKDYSDLIVYVTKNFDIKRDEITTKNNRPNFDDLKFYQIVTSEMMSRYELKKEEPKVDVVNDESKVKADTSTGGAQSTGGFAGSSAGSNPFVGGGIPRNPMFDDRFYPYRTKPKYTGKLRILIGVTAILFAVSTLLVFIFSCLIPSGTVTVKEILSSIGLSLKPENYIEGYGDGSSFSSGVGSKFTGMGFYMNVIFVIGYVAFVCWVSYRLMKPAKTYREYYTTQTMTFILFLIVLVLIFGNYIMNFNLYFIFKSQKDVVVKSIINSLVSEKNPFFKGTDDLSLEKIINTINNNTDTISKLLNDKLFGELVLTRVNDLVIVLYVFITTFVVALVTLVISWILNPRIDREKFMRMQMEVQMQMQYAMQGQQYEIDKSLYTSETEYEEIMSIIRKNKNKKTNNKDKNLD